jgi:peptidoglycan/LPS O-acetylase OafA/YrhL
LRRFVPRNDYSFGIYIYGFMMQQSVASVAPHLNHVQATLVAAPFILLCAAASWHFIERPVLAWCRGRLARETVHPVPAIAADSAAR